ncbi:unnamed protein product [Adineta steineri]|uniref:Uncharacterized protein n=1 Tax=Adineta steineri TaxID=433720 RepID=A0A814QUV4_9BILA|nr:unnamed protein product [Adineta steineri]CAF3801423.1 unnamed protein product [Adineta steineri]
MRVSSIGKGLRHSPSPRSRFCEHILNDNDKSFTCRQRIYVTCPHCQRSLCLHHINEHQLLIRSLFDSLVNRLNEYRYELTVKLSIPSHTQTLVNNCLDEFKHDIIPYVQRTCCENDVKQEDIDRVEIFINKMFTLIQQIQFYWDNNNKKDRKRSNSSDDTDKSPSTKRFQLDIVNMVLSFIVCIIWQILSFTAFVLNLTANSSDRWWVNAKEGGEKTFIRAGLWQVCFNMYRHRFDYYGKIYHGCWWLFSPEIRLLRPWILNNWLRWVQTLSTLSLITSFFAAIATLLILHNYIRFKCPKRRLLDNGKFECVKRNLSDHDEFKLSKQILTVAVLHALAGILMLATVILFGIKGKRRDWMMNWQFNWFGWSFQLAIIACILHLLTAFMACYQGLNKYLYYTYDYSRVHQEIEDRSTLKHASVSKRTVTKRGGEKQLPQNL